MKINWKEVAQSKGYISLSKAYERDVQSANRDKQRGNRPMRSKAEFRKHFVDIIRHATRYANAHNKSVGTVLTEWEEKRKQWWMNYPALYLSVSTGNSLKPQGVKYLLTYYRKQGVANKRIAEHAQLMRKNNGKKPRWTTARKTRTKQDAYLKIKYG